MAEEQSRRGRGCPRARLGPTEVAISSLHTKGMDQRTRRADCFPVLALPRPLSLLPTTPAHPQTAQLGLFGRSIMSLFGSGQQLPWLGSELRGKSPRMMYDGRGKGPSSRHPPSSSSWPIGIPFAPLPVTSTKLRL